MKKDYLRAETGRFNENSRMQIFDGG